MTDEIGKIHPIIGYVQGTRMPDGSLPEGWASGDLVPLKPSAEHEWQNGEWVHITPPEQTPEELRAQMPTLSSRQFWLAANTLGITEDMLLAATDDAEIIIEIRKTTEFHRTYDSVVMLAPLMGITPEQLDGVWLWAAAV